MIPRDAAGHVASPAVVVWDRAPLGAPSYALQCQVHVSYWDSLNPALTLIASLGMSRACDAVSGIDEAVRALSGFPDGFVWLILPQSGQRCAEFP